MPNTPHRALLGMQLTAPAGTTILLIRTNDQIVLLHVLLHALLHALLHVLLHALLHEQHGHSASNNALNA